MKKNLLVAASLLTFGIGSTVTSVAKAEDMFTVVAGSPGAITFSGSGTAQFNNSLGTNNSFQVGSSTNLGVNASVSSTTGYGVDSMADLDLANTTTLKQVIGTSGTANAASQKSTTAHTNAMTAMSSWGGGVSYDVDNNRGYSSQREWQAAFDAEYSRQYTTARSQESSSESSNMSDGTISGSFRTIEAGTARSSGSASDWDSDASVSASAEYGASYENRSSTYEASTEAEWQAGYDRSYNAAYANASAASNRYSDSTVNVTGIGSDAEVVSLETSNFLVDIGVTTDDPTGSTSTANGSAGASLATSSFANQSSSSTASGFLQAFGGSVASNSAEQPDADIPGI
tara:strand:- start:147 stop:1178 length:1032 start_codon:yes stop_codon:yes gene_type:complete